MSAGCSSSSLRCSSTRFCALHQVFHPLLVLAFLAVCQAFHQLVAVQQLDHLRQAVLQAFLRLFEFGFGHCALPVPQRQAAHRRRSIFQDADEQSRFGITG